MRRITVDDKHGISRQVYNAKVNIYRRNAEPILLGIEDRLLGANAFSRSIASICSVPGRLSAGRQPARRS